MDSQSNSFETLKDIFKDVKNIFEKIKNYGFFQRLFGLFAWKKLLKEDSTKLDSKLDDLQDIIGDLRVKFNRLDDYDEVKTENETLKKKITTIETTSDNNKKELDKKRIQYDTMTTNIENRERKKEEQEEIERDELEAERKKTWQDHETNVSEFIRRECVKYDIQYVGPQDFPDRKKPDNSIIIDERYVIFDAKSPGDSHDSASFINDLKQKAKDQEKYAQMPNVKKDIYLVVPSNLYPDIQKRHYPLGQFEVWIITIEQISVILAHYKKTKDYEKFEGLSSDDKDALIREMGNLENNLRYRIFIDNAFTRKFLDALKSSKDNLPEEINKEIEKVVIDSKQSLKRKDSGKPLSLDSIEEEFDELKLISQSRGIPTPKIEKKSKK